MESNYEGYINFSPAYQEERKKKLDKAQEMSDALGEDFVVGIDEYDFSFRICPDSCPSSYELFEVQLVSPSFEKTETNTFRM